MKFINESNLSVNAEGGLLPVIKSISAKYPDT